MDVVCSWAQSLRYPGSLSDLVEQDLFPYCQTTHFSLLSEHNINLYWVNLVTFFNSRDNTMLSILQMWQMRLGELNLHNLEITNAGIGLKSMSFQLQHLLSLHHTIPWQLTIHYQSLRKGSIWVKRNQLTFAHFQMLGRFVSAPSLGHGFSSI